jgi:hypothetical protein
VFQARFIQTHSMATKLRLINQLIERSDRAPALIEKWQPDKNKRFICGHPLLQKYGRKWIREHYNTFGYAIQLFHGLTNYPSTAIICPLAYFIIE